MGGWIKIFSKFLQWEWFDKANVKIHTNIYIFTYI